MKTLVRNDEQLSDVYRYFEETWLDGFGVELISQYEMFRTNNCAESFHNSLRTTFPSPHPNFYDFVEKSEIMDRAEHEFNVERVNPKKNEGEGVDDKRKDQTVDRHLLRPGRLDAGTPGTPRQDRVSHQRVVPL